MNPRPNKGPLPIELDTLVLCSTIIVAPQLFGGAFPWTVVAIAILSLGCLGATLVVRRREFAPTIDALLLGMLGAWLFTCVQSIPLPAELAESLGLASVVNARRFDGLSWVGRIPLTISQDLGSTRLQILIGIAVLAPFIAARLAGSAQLRPLAIATVVSATLIGLSGLVHRAAEVDAVFGVYTPRFAAPNLLTPLMNGNHLGGFAMLGALLGAGLAVQGREARNRWLAASAFCSVIVAWTLSRGAIGGLLFGFVLFAGWLLAARGASRRQAVVPLAALGAAAIGVAAFVGLESIAARFQTQGLDKIAVAARGLRLLDDGPTWWLGIGRGAFSATFVAEEGSLTRVTHPENIFVQWSTEWGLPLAIALLSLLLFALSKRLRETEDPLIAASCIGIVALGLQNSVDFSLEMAGIVVVVAAVLGALLPVASPKRRSGSIRVQTGVFMALTLALGFLGPRVIHSDAQSIIDKLGAEMARNDEAGFEATLRRGLALHPSEPSLALLAGTYAGAQRSEEAPRWLSIAMEQAPGWAAPHVVTAQLLLAEGKVDQALVEVREAENRQGRAGFEVLCQVLRQTPSLEQVERAAPAGDARANYLARAAACPAIDAELRAAIDQRVLLADPTRPSSVLRESHRRSTEGDAAAASAMLQRALAHHAKRPDLWDALVRVHLRAGEPAEARSALDGARAAGVQDASLLKSQARVEAASGEANAMRATMTRLRGQAQGDARLLARAFALEGELEASLGNIDEALASYSAADAADPTSSALFQAARLALDSGRMTSALRNYHTLCDRDPGGAACDIESRLRSGSPKTAPPGALP